MAIARIIYINLSDRPDKKKFMEAQLSSLNIPYDRFCAIRPSVEDLGIGGIYNDFYKRAEERPVRETSPNMRLERTPARAIGEYGCYLSHYYIHKKAVEENWDNYLILEDDCILSEGWLELVNKYTSEGKIPGDWDIIRSIWDSTEEVVRIESCNRQSRFMDPRCYNVMSGGTHFQLCKGERAQQIVDYLDMEYVYNIDSVYSTNRLSVYHTKFNIELTDAKSDIFG